MPTTELKIKLTADAGDINKILDKIRDDIEATGDVDLDTFQHGLQDAKTGTEKIAGAAGKLDSEFKKAGKAAGAIGDELEDGTRQAKKAGRDAGKQFSDGFDDEIDGLGDQLDEMLSGIGGGGGFAGGLLGGAIGGGIGGGIAQIGAQALSKAVDLFDDQAKAMRQLRVATNATDEELEQLHSTAERAMLRGLGDNVTDASAKIALLQQHLGRLKDDTGQALIDPSEFEDLSVRISNLSKAYDKPYEEILGKTRTLIANYQTDWRTALDNVSLGLRDGASGMDDYLDTIDEYSQLAVKAGYDISTFTGLLTTAVEKGSRDTDKIADSIKETQIRINAMDFVKPFQDMEAAAQGAELEVVQMVRSLADQAQAGDISIADMMGLTAAELKRAFDAGEISASLRDQIEVALSGTMPEDIGGELWTEIFSADIDPEVLAAKAKEAGDVVDEAFEPMGFEKFMASMELQFSKLAGMIFPIIDPLIGTLGDSLMPIMEDIFTSLKPIFTILGPIAKILGEWIGLIITLNPAFMQFSMISNAAGEGMDELGEILNEAADIFGEVATLVKDVVAFGFELFGAAVETAFLMIGDLIGEFFDFREEGEETGSAVDSLSGIFDNFEQTLLNIRGTINGVKLAVGEIGGIIRQLYAAYHSLDFAEVYNIIKGAGDKISKAYDEGWNEVANESAESAKKASDEIAAAAEDGNNKINRKLDKKPTNDNLNKALEERKRAVEDYNTYIEMITAETDTALASINDQEAAAEIARLERQKESLSEIDSILESIRMKNQLQIDVKISEERERTEKERIEREYAEEIETKRKITDEILKNEKLTTEEKRRINEEYNRWEVLKAEERENAVKAVETRATEERRQLNIQAEQKISEQKMREAEEAEYRRINMIEDLARQEYELAVFEAKKAYEERIVEARGNAALEYQAFLDLQAAKLAAEEQYLRDSATITQTAIAGIADDMRNAFSDISFTDEDMAAQAEDNIKALEDEEDALRESYANREIDRAEYVNRMAALNEKQREANQELADAEFDLFGGMVVGIKSALAETTDRLKTELDKRLEYYQDFNDKREALDEELSEKGIEYFQLVTSGQVEEAAKVEEEIETGLENRNKMEQDAAKVSEELYGSMAAHIGMSTAQMIMDGENAVKAMVLATLDGLQALVPIFAAQILGAELASKSFAGFATAAALTAVLSVAVAAARAAVSGLAFETGGTLPGLAVDETGLVEGGKKVIGVQVNESGREFIVNAHTTAKNLHELEQINRENLTIREYALRDKSIRHEIIKEIMPPHPSDNRPIQVTVDLGELKSEFISFKKEIAKKLPTKEIHDHSRREVALTLDSRPVGERIDMNNAKKVRRQ